jgi:hypothetical protein
MSITLSVRIPAETKTWLQHFAKSRGSAGAAAARLLHESRLREEFPGIEFRDTPLGRVSYVQGTRVQLALLLSGEKIPTAEAVARHYGWPLWKSASALAYLRTHLPEVKKEAADLAQAETALTTRVPGLQRFPGRT